MLRIRPACHHRTGTVELAADVRPGQPDRAQLAISISSKARAQEDVAADVKALTVQSGARRVGDGGAGAFQLDADARPSQPYRAPLICPVGRKARVQQGTASDMHGAGREGRARGVGEGGAGTIQPTADPCPPQRHRAVAVCSEIPA